MLKIAQYGFGIALVIAWGWMLGRPLLMSLLNTAHRDPIGHFNRQIDALGDAPRQSVSHLATGGRGPVGVGGDPARKRRLQLFLALCISAVVSLPLALIFGGLFLQLHILMDVVLLGFVAVAARAGAAEVERQQKVAYLQPVPSRMDTAVSVRAVGGSR